MVIIDTFYQLIERDTRKVSRLWKGLQVVGYTCSSIAGIIATISFYNLLSVFDMNCVLYADIKFTPVRRSNPKYVLFTNVTNATIDALLTTWKPDFLCQYCLAIWMMSFVGGLTLGFFFILNPKGGRGSPNSLFTQPWKMINPMLMVTLAMSILTGVGCGQVVAGINKFCAEFENFTGNTSCTDKIDIFSLKFRYEEYPVHHTQQIIKASSVLTFIGWLCCSFFLVVRVCLAPDFNLQILIIKPRRRRLVKTKQILSQPSVIINPDKITGIQYIPETENLQQPRQPKGKKRPRRDGKDVKLGMMKMM